MCLYNFVGLKPVRQQIEYYKASENAINRMISMPKFTLTYSGAEFYQDVNNGKRFLYISKFGMTIFEEELE